MFVLLYYCYYLVYALLFCWIIVITCSCRRCVWFMCCFAIFIVVISLFYALLWVFVWSYARLDVCAVLLYWCYYLFYALLLAFVWSYVCLALCYGFLCFDLLPFYVFCFGSLRLRLLATLLYCEFACSLACSIASNYSCRW